MSAAKFWRGWSNTGENHIFHACRCNQRISLVQKYAALIGPFFPPTSFSIPFHPGWQNLSARLFQVREELTIESAGQTRAAADPSKTSASPQISAFASSSTG